MAICDNSVKTILYTSASASAQSGAYRILIDMFRGIRSRRFEAVLALPYSGDKFPLLSTVELQQTYKLSPKPASKNRLKTYVLLVQQNWRLVRELVRIIKQENISIVHVNEIFDIYGAVAARLTGAKCLWNVRAELSAWPILNYMLPFIVSYLADSIVVASESVRQNTFDRPGIDQDKIKIIYDPGFDVNEFHPNVNGGSVRANLGISDKAPIILMVAKLAKRKGHELLIGAVPHLLKKHPDAQFVFVGGELDGEHHQRYAANLRRQVELAGLIGHVVWAGYQGNIPEVMAASDIIIHCSTYPDPFPGVVLQGMAVGKPVVAPNLGGPKEQIEHNVTGILIKPNCSISIAEALDELLSDQEKRNRLGLAASHSIQTSFDFEHYFEKLASEYESLLSMR